MLKVKYKMHKFVNLLFYVIVWVSGYLVGFGMKGGNIIEKIKILFNNI